MKVARPVRRAAWGNGSAAMPVPRPRPTQLAFLITVVVTDTTADSGCHASEAAGPPPFLPDPRVPIRLTLAEARHLLAALVIQPVRGAPHILRWSTWRRLHQAAARAHHYKRRNVDP